MKLARARRYEQGVPLPLSFQEIAAYLAFADVPVDAPTFEQVVYALDEEVLKQV